MYREHRLIPGSKETRSLDQLLQFLDNYFTSTRKSLIPLVEHFEITYELLWALFRPNALLYTTCPGSEQSRCLIFDSGKEKWVSPEEKQFELQCRYFGYNGKSFGEVTTFFYIPRFNGVKSIASLNIFPLQYHESKTEITRNLVEQGRRFTTLMGSHHCNYKGLAYIQQAAGPFQFTVEGRIMIDAASFKEINPNYGSQCVARKSSDAIVYILTDQNSDMKQDQKGVSSKVLVPSEMRDEELLLCSPTVLGFSLSKRLWG